MSKIHFFNWIFQIFFLKLLFTALLPLWNILYHLGAFGYGSLSFPHLVSLYPIFCVCVCAHERVNFHCSLGFSSNYRLSIPETNFLSLAWCCSRILVKVVHRSNIDSSKNEHKMANIPSIPKFICGLILQVAFNFRLSYRTIYKGDLALNISDVFGLNY